MTTPTEQTWIFDSTRLGHATVISGDQQIVLQLSRRMHLTYLNSVVRTRTIELFCSAERVEVSNDAKLMINGLHVYGFVQQFNQTFCPEGIRRYISLSFHVHGEQTENSGSLWQHRWLVSPTHQSVAPKIPQGCDGCKHLHGEAYGGNLLVCAMHPYGTDGDSCPDKDWNGYVSAEQHHVTGTYLQPVITEPTRLRMTTPNGNEVEVMAIPQPDGSFDIVRAD